MTKLEGFLLFCIILASVVFFFLFANAAREDLDRLFERTNRLERMFYQMNN